MMVVPNEVRKARQKQIGEVFTPPELVNKMLDKLPVSVWKEDETFCDPSCGNGEFLIWTLIRKLQKGHDALGALKSLYGVDIQKDNVIECRARLLKVVSCYESITDAHIEAVVRNIIRWNALKYSFDFRKPKQSTVEAFAQLVYDDGLEDVTMPEFEL